MFERSPDLKIGVTLLFFQIWGEVEDLSDRLNIWVCEMFKQFCNNYMVACSICLPIVIIESHHIMNITIMEINHQYCPININPINIVQDIHKPVPRLYQMCSTVNKMIANIIKDIVFHGWLETEPILIQLSKHLKMRHEKV